MIHGSESFVQFGQSNFELAFTVADITLQSTERLVDLQMKTAKEALEQGLRNVHQRLAVLEAQDFLAGMTDRYAVHLFEQLFIPKPWVETGRRLD